MTRIINEFIYRSRKKGERERIIKDLEKKGMMPSKKFDYKIVDFSAFQGGSQNVPNQVQFEQTMVRISFIYISFHYHLMNL